MQPFDSDSDTDVEEYTGDVAHRGPAAALGMAGFPKARALKLLVDDVAPPDAVPTSEPMDTTMPPPELTDGGEPAERAAPPPLPTPLGRQAAPTPLP